MAKSSGSGGGPGERMMMETTNINKSLREKQLEKNIAILDDMRRNLESVTAQAEANKKVHLELQDELTNMVNEISEMLHEGKDFMNDLNGDQKTLQTQRLQLSSLNSHLEIFEASMLDMLQKTEERIQIMNEFYNVILKEHSRINEQLITEMMLLTDIRADIRSNRPISATVGKNNKYKHLSFGSSYEADTSSTSGPLTPGTDLPTTTTISTPSTMKVTDPSTPEKKREWPKI